MACSVTRGRKAERFISHGGALAQFAATHRFQTVFAELARLTLAEIETILT